MIKHYSSGIFHPVAKFFTSLTTVSNQRDSNLPPSDRSSESSSHSALWRVLQLSEQGTRSDNAAAETAQCSTKDFK
ncbi:hypothetical protein RRG08_047820 [Elysia crispata]|uniref:Uncharacterized protein n=1 Tax=Elysia crispata TaxID=231223 RepID=A0AAE1CS79_9GAST|nr:hypothetical protein RRG08_047820 [Elysia crispata]